MTARIALVLSVLSLIVGLSAPAIASVLVTSTGIKDGTILKKDLAPSTIKAMKGPRGFDGLDGVNGFDAVGATGPAGPTGPAGAAGAAGVAGGFNPAKISYVTGPSITITSGNVGGALANCPAGTKVIGGGFFSGISNVGGTGVNTNEGTQWYVVVYNDTSIDMQVNATAVCAAP